jgi:hypothetical protein
MLSVVSSGSESFVLISPAQGVAKGGLISILKNVSGRFHGGDIASAFAHGIGQLFPVEKVQAAHGSSITMGGFLRKAES